MAEEHRFECPYGEAFSTISRDLSTALLWLSSLRSELNTLSKASGSGSAQVLSAITDLRIDQDARLHAVAQQLTLVSQQVAEVRRTQASYQADTLMLLNLILSAIKMLNAPTQIVLDVEHATTKPQPLPPKRGP